MKTTNISQTKYVEVKKQESKYELYISKIKGNKQSTRVVYADWNLSSKVWLIYSEILRHEKRYGWCFLKLIDEKDGTTDVLSGYEANKNGTPVVFIVSAARRKMSLIHWKFKVPEEW